MEDSDRSRKERKGQNSDLCIKSKQKNQAVSAVHGNIYQLKLLMLFLYRGVSLGYYFRLATEVEEADKFDDLMFEYTKNNKKVYRLLQAKHKLVESKKITAHNLLNEKNGDYNLIKYFKSYQSSKNSDLFKDGSIKDVIICTNIDFDFENLKREKIGIKEIEDKDDILDVRDGDKQPNRYRFSKDLAASEKMSELSVDEVEDFLDHLVFAVNQPNEEELGKIIKDELGKEFDFDLITTENVYNKFFVTMLKWFQGKERRKFLSYEEGREFFEEAKAGIPIWFCIKDPLESFVGRSEILEYLHRILQDEDTTVTSQDVCISGLGGIGKSELLRKYIHEHSHDYDNKVIWINAETYQTLAESFRRLASDKLRISTKNVNGEEKEMISIVEDVYKFFSHGKSLFIFDNAEKYRSQNELDQGIDKFLLSRSPNNKKRPHIVITSRNRKWPKKIKVLPLDVFTEEEAMKLIKNSLSVQNDEQDSKIKDLSKELQYFPLALQQAVSYIRAENEKMKNVGSGFMVSNYLEIFREKTEKLLDFEFPDDSDNEYAKTTYVTWDVTLGTLTQKENGMDALEILNVVSYLTPEDIPVELLVRYISDKGKVASAIELLKQYSMINLEQEKLNVHRLVQHVTRMKLGKQNREHEILKNILQIFDKDYVNSKTVDQAISVWNYSNKYNKLIKEFLRIPSCICIELTNSARYEEAYLFALKTLELLNKMPDDDSNIKLSVSVIVGNLAATLVQQGKYDVALKLYLMVLPIQIFYKSNDPLVLSTINNIALIMFNKGEYDTALAYYEEVLAKSKIVSGENHPNTLLIKHDVAGTMSILNKKEEALKIFREVHTIQEKTLGKNHSDTLNTENSIAIILASQGKHNEALKMWQRVHSSLQAIFNNNHPRSLITKKNIAGILAGQGRYNEALQTYREILSAEKAVLGDEHPHVLITGSQIGEVLQKQSKYYEALETLREVFDKQKKTLGPDHPNTIDTKYKIAHNLHELGKYSDAMEIYQEVLTAKRVVFENDHTETLSVKSDIATIFSQQGEYDKALQHYQEILKIQERSLGYYHPLTMTIKNSIATCFYGKKEYDKAMDILEDVFSSLQNLYPNEPLTLITKSNIAMVLFRQGKNHEALKTQREVFSSQEAILGKEHHYTLETKYHIAKILLEQGNLTEALINFQEVFEGFQKALGPDNFSTLEVKNMIESLRMLTIRPNSIFTAIKNNDLQTIKAYRGKGGDINVKDNAGKTLLHYASENGNIGIVNILLEYGAYVTCACNGGKTALHIATSKGFKEIVKILLKNVKHNKLKEFVDARITSDGTTSLHTVVEKGYLGIALSLLKHGATYDVKNKGGKTPLELSTNRDVTNFFKLIAELFEDSKCGNYAITNKLKAMESGRFLAVTNARNSEGHTLLQVAINNKHKTIASKLIEILRNKN